MAKRTKDDSKQKTAPATRTKRFLKLAGMTASVAGSYAAERVRRAFNEEDKEERQARAYDKMANQIADTLGELKGAVMKVGQIASQTQDFLPKEFSQALQRLQKEAPPMDYEVIARQVERELGAPPEELFKEFSEEPYAAASIGQVHKAVTLDGKEVIVKVQYPGVDRSVDSDLKQLKLTLKLGGLLKLPKESVDQLFEEIRERLNEELDYENEARNIADFQRFHAKDEGLIIPSVVRQLSSKRVLTMECVEGDHISAVSAEAYGQEVINLIGRRLFRIMADQLFKFHAIHGDPHAGNFAFRPDGSIIMYDFGCVKRLKPEIVHAYSQALTAGLNADYDALDNYLVDLGVRVSGKPAVEQDYYAMWRDIFIRPFRSKDEEFDFASSNLHKQVASKATTVFKYMDFFQPPVESLFIDRMIAGHYWMMMRLGVQAAFRKELEDYLDLSSAA
ncbi:predicted unusual protein kinase [Hahella chejuensis KCTC 2396]|uniref:Predicted unusual protein kinase n=1 Tax=Hahella chejuensis (strain KCTC 2396) TaxID=349521 RepID=Q2SLF6_HAHCH|nr:AarF/ABC1/UbiB kinase family protein [Hahella chejuensis]ABC28518.1 predicted unusual protein kinase [Hahella chejuensis KCTC 2396]